MNDQSLDKLTRLGTDAVQSAINQYTQWEWTASILWILFGLVLIVVAAICIKRREHWDEEMFPWAIAVLLFLSSGLIVVANVPDLIFPRAKAIHQLLQDATGKQ